MGAAPAHAALDLDGRLDERDWQNAAFFDHFLQVDPETREPAQFSTHARVVALEDGLALGITANVPRNLRKYGRSPRDADPMDADSVRVAIDFDDAGRAAYEFAVSLSGSVRDGVFFNQNEYSADWDGTWFHAVAEDDDAWHVEILIPWSVVPAAERAGGDRAIGLWIALNVERQRREFAFPALATTRPTFVSDFHELTLPRYSAAALDWFPYASVSGDRLTGTWKVRSGLDVQWKNGSGDQLTATLYPDYGQVESDDLVVNFSAVESFFSEKRPFFTENHQLFDLRTPINGRLVNTRRIGAAPDAGGASASRVIAAAKYTASGDHTDYGAFAAVEGDTGNIEGRSYLVGRVRLRADEVAYGYLGTLTDNPAIDRQAQVHALDAEWLAAEGVRVRAMAIGSLIEAADARDGAAAYAILDYDRGGRLRSETSLTWFDRNFEINDLGFLPRRNLQRALSRTIWTKRDYASGSPRALSSWEFKMDAQRADAGYWLSSRIAMLRQIRFRNGSSFGYFCNYDPRGIDDLITRGNGLVKVPTRVDCGADYQAQSGPRWRYEMGGSVYEEGVRGGFATELYVNPRVIWMHNLSTDVLLSYVTSPDWVVYLTDSGQLVSFERELATVSATLNWFPRRNHDVRARLQVAGVAARAGREFVAGPHGELTLSGVDVAGFRQGEMGFQLRYRIQIRPLSDLFVVYSRGGFVFERGEDGLGALWPDAAEQKTAEQFLVKLRYRF